MKRRICFVLIGLLVAGVGAMAGNRLAKEGYVWNVGFNVTPQLGLGVELLTSHGYSFGNGLWMGGGTGVCFGGIYGGLCFPLYADAKYTFMKEKKVSPFVDCKLGFTTDMEDIYTQISPAVGVDIDRFSISVIYNIWYSLRTINLGCAFNF